MEENFLQFFFLLSQKFALYFMKNHIVSGRHPLNNINDDLTMKTLAGTTLHIKKLRNVRFTN